MSLSMVEPLFIFIPSSMPSEHRIEPIIISEHVRLRYIRVMYSLAEYLGAGKLFGVYKLGGAVVVEMIRSIVRSVYASPTRSITHNSLMEVDELDNIPELKTAVEALVDSYFAKLVTSTPSVANLHGEILTVISSYILKSNIPVSSTSTTGTFSRILDACLANAINDTSSLTSVENIIIFKTCLDKILGLFPLDDTSPEHLAILEKWDVLLTGEIGK